LNDLSICDETNSRGATNQQSTEPGTTLAGKPGKMLMMARFAAEAIPLLEKATAQTSGLPDQSWGVLPLVHYTFGWLHEKLGDEKSPRKLFQRAAALPQYSD
jgi:hypothetical protein